MNMHINFPEINFNIALYDETILWTRPYFPWDAKSKNITGVPTEVLGHVNTLTVNLFPELRLI